MTAFIENAAIVFLFACLAGAAVCGAMSFYCFRQHQHAAREAARYERQERFRQALKAQQSKDRAICVEWVRVKLRERDAEWIARIIVMERNSTTGRIAYRQGETTATLGWL